jgi:hypothetical protein
MQPYRDLTIQTTFNCILPNPWYFSTKVIPNCDNLGRVNVRPARRSIVQATIAVAFTAAVALAASATHADAGAREINASSYGFSDSAWTANGLEPPPALSPRIAGWSPGCFVDCGPAFGTFVVRRSDLLTSNTADLSARKTADGTGHSMGVGGAIVVERLESDGAGSLTNWVVVSERIVDENGSHSWSLMSGVPSDAPWTPNDLYRFEGSSFSVDLAAEPSASPEASTWMMTLIGLVAVTFASYRNSRSGRFSTLMRKGALV